MTDYRVLALPDCQQAHQPPEKGAVLVSDHRNANIVAVRAAMDRVQRRMKELESPFEFPRDCCPSCACGTEWNRLSDKHERQAAWLRKLLTDRAGEGDVKEARRLESCFGVLSLERHARTVEKRFLESHK